jgi:ArsR family transcriptional regulator, arsenate/arsenite/antimonite-responsive transcriptional repressor
MAALAQETRLDAFRLLAMRAPDGLHATEIADLLRVAKNTMSLHFRVLEDAGLVTAERQGRHVTYRADLKTYDALLAFMSPDDDQPGRGASVVPAVEPSG